MTAFQHDTGQRGVNVQTLLNAHPFSSFQWLIFALCFPILLCDGFDTAAIGYLAPSLISAWGVSKPMLAYALSAALFGLAAGAMLSEPLADRLGRKTALVGAAAPKRNPARCQLSLSMDTIEPFSPIRTQESKR